MQHFMMDYTLQANSGHTSLIHGRVNQNAFSLRAIRAQSDRALASRVTPKASPGDLGFDLIVEIERVNLLINKFYVVIDAFWLYCAQDQSSTSNPGTRMNSFKLFVTTTKLWAFAMLAI